ncbi:parathyroid hormone 2 receptor-like [Mercenaria mercenaria]|uniref:parathyroid hormone 2 receptor-like n=1 Tax=Mercenaria mercenaria TaxID=6596 RepID=UPI00234F85C2|nr:parathyroid hormone 2 receptor-like [Mercenaria mercenaria]
MDLKCCLYVACITVILNGVFGDVAHITEVEQLRFLFYKHLECQHLMNMTNDVNTTDGIYCPRIWDNIMCWPEAKAGTVASQQCPFYINKFKTHEFAFRECLPNGTWLDPRTNKSLDDTGWTNFSQCITTENHPDDAPKSKGVVSLVTRHQDAFRKMYNTGYFMSLVSLLLAIIVMLYFRKLHCARNYIHLNLFLSFLLRAALSVIRDNTWEHHLGFPSDVETLPNGTIVYTDGPHWECRSFFTLYKYVLVASYMWIFMEAVYIHMIIFVSVFTEKTRVVWYIIIGWSKYDFFCHQSD